MYIYIHINRVSPSRPWDRGKKHNDAVTYGSMPSSALPAPSYLHLKETPPGLQAVGYDIVHSLHQESARDAMEVRGEVGWRREGKGRRPWKKGVSWMLWCRGEATVRSRGREIWRRRCYGGKSRPEEWDVSVSAMSCTEKVNYFINIRGMERLFAFFRESGCLLWEKCPILLCSEKYQIP